MADEPDNQVLGIGDGDAPDTPNTPQLSETEQLAQEMGWRPQTEYKGDPERWKPAKDFILAERDISRSMKRDVKSLRDQVDRMASASTKATERALRSQAEQLTRQFEEAVEKKDVRGAAEAAKGMRELEVAARPDSGNVEQDFARDNPWYGKDDDATAYAITISQRLAGQGKSVDEQLEAAAAGVRKVFPHLFGEEKQKARQPAELHTPSGRLAPRKEKGFADLPPDVKRAAESHAKLANSRFGVEVEKAKRDYAADYFADQAA